jgi:precorrin-6B methylase 1
LPKNLFVVGVGPGSPKYLTDTVKEAIHKSHYIAGYKYTLTIVESLLNRSIQKIYEITMKTQEDIYRNIYTKMSDGDYCTVPFTGDVNFSESEVVDRLLELFGNDNVEVIPGISSIQIAAAKSRVPLDKAHIVTFHVTSNIEQKKMELLKAVMDMKSVILLPRPWPKEPTRNFMQSDIAIFLKKNGIDTSNLNTGYLKT